MSAPLLLALALAAASPAAELPSAELPSADLPSAELPAAALPSAEAPAPAESAPAPEPSLPAPIVERTPNFVVRAVPAATGEALRLAQTLEADRELVAAELGRAWDGPTEVRVAAPNDGSFERLLPPGASAPKWAAAIAFPARNLVVMRLPLPRMDARAILRHELSHVAVGRLAPGRVPRWFLEGLATIQAGDLWSRQGPSLVRAALAEGLFAFDSLRDGFPAYSADAELAYAQSADFVQFLVDRGGEDKLHLVLRRILDGVPFESAMAEAFGARPRALENQWRRSLARWELLVRYLTSGELWWTALAFLFLFAWWKVRQRHRRRLRLMEQQEQAEAAAAPPGPPDPAAFEAWLDEPAEGPEPSRPPGKPTLH